MNIQICADDIGQDPSINDGCLELFQLGNLGAVSILVEAPHVQTHRNVLLEAHRLGLELGLHFNLTLPFQTSIITKPLSEWIIRSQIGLVPKNLVLASFQKQLNDFEDTFQVGPNFVDGHQHIHQFPQIRDVFIEELVRRYPKNTPWIRSTVLPSGAINIPEAFKCQLINLLGGGSFRRNLLMKSLHFNQGFLGVYGFNAKTSDLYGQLMELWLQNATENCLIMVHPSKSRVENDGIGHQRPIEFDYLRSSSFKRALSSRKIAVRSLTF